MQKKRVRNKSTGRNYKREYEIYQSKPEQKKARARRNKANRLKGTYGNHDGLDVAHQDNNTHNNSKSNLRLQSPGKNRGFARTKGGHRKRRISDN